MSELMSKKSVLISAIEEMLSGNINKKYAICENLEIKVKQRFAYSVTSKFCSSWENYSGEEHYPVGGESIWDKCLWTNPPSFWEGEQRELRISLLKHIKSEVSKISEEEFEEVFK